MSPVPAQIERFVVSDRGALRAYLVFFILTLAGGLVLAVIGFNGADGEGLYFKLGGVLVASLGSFPLKEYISLRSRIATLLNMRDHYNDLAAQATPPQAEMDRVKDLIWKLYEKRALT